MLRAAEVVGIAVMIDTKLNTGENVEFRMVLENIVWVKPE